MRAAFRHLICWAIGHRKPLVRYEQGGAKYFFCRRCRRYLKTEDWK